MTEIVAPVRGTPFGNPKCFAKELQNCNETITKEHFFSAGILSRMKEVHVKGFHWQKTPLQQVSVASLAAKVLCENHNSYLSVLDRDALRFYDALVRKPEPIGEEDSAAPRVDHRMFHGEALERWFLKMMCGTIASGTASVKGERVTRTLEDKWVSLLFVNDPWPPSWGLYVSSANGQTFTVAHGLEFFLLVDEHDGTPKGATIRLGGFTFGLVLCDNGSPGSIWRPQGMVIKERGITRVLEFGWQGISTPKWTVMENRNLSA